MKRFVIKASAITVGVVLLLWIGSLVKCEVLTNRYGTEFQELYKDSTLLEGIDHLKVLDYTSDIARIYYVAKDRSSGNILVFGNENGKWIGKN